MQKKLNILYIAIDGNLGGSTRSLYNLIDSIKDRIYPIVLFGAYGTGYDYYKQKGIECYVFPYIKLYNISCNKLKDVIFHPWRWHYIKKSVYDYSCYFFIKRKLNGRSVDIVHTNTSPNDIGVFLSKRLKSSHVWHVREFCDLDFHYKIYGGMSRLRKLISDADARVAISTAIKRHWEMPETNTWVIPNAVRSRNEACYFPIKEKYVLFSSYALSETKGCRNVIIAFSKSGIAREGYILKMMGNCTEEYKSSLVQTAIDNNVADKIEFIPCQQDVTPFFSHASVYVMASESEAFGRVTAEAMFFGCPVIAKASGGTLDFVKNGETGYLYDNIRECAQLIYDVCHSPQKEIIMRAQQYAINNLSQEEYAPQIMDVYNHVIDGKSPDR